MKALITDLAKTATISSLYETLTYPPSNVIDTFLDLPFVSVLDTDTLTLDLGSDKVLDSVFIAGCNAASVTVLIKNAALATVYNQVKTLSYPVVGVYTGTLTGRYISITGTAVGSSYFKIKGVGVGVAFDFGDVIAGFGLPVVNATSSARSATGQTMANSAPTLRQRDIEIPIRREEGGRTQVYAIHAQLEALGISNPTYWDITDENHGFEAPIYAALPDVWDTADNRNSFTISLSLLEAR